MMPGKWSVKELFMVQSEKLHEGQRSKTLYEQVTIERNKPIEEGTIIEEEPEDFKKRS